MARLPDLVAASPRAARSNDSARHAFVIGPAASAGITPSAASARASAASKSSMFCRHATSSQIARIAALDSIGASSGERDVLICGRPNHPRLPLPMPLIGLAVFRSQDGGPILADRGRPAAFANMHRSSSQGGLSLCVAVHYLGNRFQALREAPSMAMTMNGEVQLAAPREAVWA